MMNLPLIYIAGPYRSPSHWGVEQNIQRARRVGAEVACVGGFPVIPHASTAHFEGLLPDTIDEQDFFLSGTLLLMLRCNALMTVEGWERSIGTSTEIRTANEHAIPVFHDIGKLKEWIERWARRTT